MDDKDLKMVLLQEIHEETTSNTSEDRDNVNDNGATTTASSTHGDDGDDHNNNSNSTSKTASSSSSSFSTTTKKKIITTTSIQYSSYRRLWDRYVWNRVDEMDRMIVSSTLPLAALTSIIPLVAGADLFWVNQLRNALAVSAQSAANLVYQFSFGLFSFLPSVTATLVSKHFANDDLEGTQDVICQSLLFALTLSTIAASIMFLYPSKFLGSVLKGTNEKERK
jgi:hypothetical protein